LLLPARFGNGLLGAITGVEVAPEWRATTFLRLRGSYSFAHIDLKQSAQAKDVGSIPGIEGGTPLHQSSIQSAFDMPKRFTLDLTWRYVSALTGQAIPAYSTGDARLAWRFHPRIEFSVVGQNLLQPSHPEFLGDPGPFVGIRRGVYAKVTWAQ
jgi:iron complex outermembrane recepter protein